MQEKSVDFLRIDINSGQVRKSIAICQSDTTMRTLSISLVDNGTVLDLSTCVFAEILIKKADDYEADNGCVIDGNSVEYTLRSTDISALGTNLAQIMLTFKDGSVITTPSFEIEVYSKILNPNVQKSSNEYTSLTQQVAIATTQAETATKAATDATETLEKCNDVYTNVKNASIVVDEAMTARDEAKEYAQNAKDSEENAQSYKAASKAYSEDAAVSETNAAASETSAATSASNAATSETNAATSESSAATSATTATASATNASTSKDSAYSYMTSAQSYSEDAKNYYNKAKAIADDLGHALVPKGTTTFENLPALSSCNIGDMYNISNDFTTTDDFVEGSGKSVGAGTNIYCIEIDSVKKWDMMSGQSIIVVDEDLSDTSTNPVANKTVKGALDTKPEIVYCDTKADYDALPSTKLTDGKIYVINEDSDTLIDSTNISFSDDNMTSTNVEAGIREAYDHGLQTSSELSSEDTVLRDADTLGGLYDADDIKSVIENFNDLLKVQKTTLTITFSSGLASDTSLKDNVILSAEVLGNWLSIVPQVASGKKVGYAFYARNSTGSVDTGVSGSVSVTVTYI